MAYKKDERTLAADIKISVLNKFEKQWKARGQVQKRAVEAALRLWTSLPEDLQARLLAGGSGDEDFVSVVQQIVDRRIKAANLLPAKSRKK
jgi:hypothetical protein